MNTLDQVKAIIGDYVGKAAADIGDDDTLASLNLDSLDRVEMQLRIEDHFNVNLGDNEEDTPAKVAALVDAKLASQPTFDQIVENTVRASPDFLRHVAPGLLTGTSVTKTHADGTEEDVPLDSFFSDPMSDDKTDAGEIEVCAVPDGMKQLNWIMDQARAQADEIAGLGKILFPPHVQRMHAEAAELQERITKLHAFIEGETFETLGEMDQALMVSQLGAMTSYSMILLLRIERAGVGTEELADRLDAMQRTHAAATGVGPAEPFPYHRI